MSLLKIWAFVACSRVNFTFTFTFFILICNGPGSSVGIKTDYRQDGPGSNPSGDEIFRPSRPALGPTQHPIKWIPFLSQG